MNILVFDTETIGLEKQFVYNLGYIIADTESGKILCARDFVVKNVYDNKPLFETAYYAQKRPIYVSRMKGRKAEKIYWGECCRRMIKDMLTYEVKECYAYNARFDISAFNFMSDFYKCKRRPLEIASVCDIMNEIGIVTSSSDYKAFCEINQFMTKNNKVKRTAESLYAFITNNKDYKEEHTALADSLIEYAILRTCRELSK